MRVLSHYDKYDLEIPLPQKIFFNLTDRHSCHICPVTLTNLHSNSSRNNSQILHIIIVQINLRKLKPVQSVGSNRNTNRITRNSTTFR